MEAGKRGLKVFFGTLLLFAMAQQVMAFERIISPAPGSWVNKQLLVLDTSDGAECFYSYSGSDPLTSGFAYDGPVLIDASGAVSVRIAVVLPAAQEEMLVEYTVIDPDTISVENGSVEEKFLTSVMQNPLYPCSASVPLVIPETLQYKFGNSPASFAAGKSLSVDAENSLSRYLPCEISYKGKCWRFIISLTSDTAGTLSRQYVPFEIQDWATFVFTGKKQIWSIDGGEWSGSSVPVVIDRSVSHTISWQSVAYDPLNPVQTFVLPPQPSLKVVAMDSKAVQFVISGDNRYRMSLIHSGAGGDISGENGFFTQLLFDVYAGDAIAGTAIVAIYCNGVYQGVLTGSYAIDRQPPQAPRMQSSSSVFFARSTVNVSFTAEDGVALYCAVSNPLILNDIQKINISSGAADFSAVKMGLFAQNFSFKISLTPGRDTAVYYKVYSYVVDQSGNESSVSTYDVVIDPYDYYVTAGDPDENADGSPVHPFRSFKLLPSIINANRFTRVYVSGSVPLTGGTMEFSSDCAFVGGNDAHFLLPADAVISVRGASFSVTGCVFEREKADTGVVTSNSFFIIENGVINFENCELIVFFGESGTMISARSSALFVNTTGITAQADSYVSALTVSDTKTTVKNSRISTIAATSVNFSVNGGVFELKDSSCKVISHLGRVGELISTQARMTNNTYIGQLQRRNSQPLTFWKDDSTVVLSDAGNVSNGF
jgi:hypothetical protein